MLGLKGWQWLFLLEGVPTVVLGVWVWLTLAPAPLEASFLTQPEREYVHQRVKANKVSLHGHPIIPHRVNVHHHGVNLGLADERWNVSRVWLGDFVRKIVAYAINLIGRRPPAGGDDAGQRGADDMVWHHMLEGVGAGLWQRLGGCACSPRQQHSLCIVHHLCSWRRHCLFPSMAGPRCSIVHCVRIHRHHAVRGHVLDALDSVCHPER